MPLDYLKWVVGRIPYPAENLSQSTGFADFVRQEAQESELCWSEFYSLCPDPEAK